VRRLSVLLLEVALFFSAIAAVGYLLRMVAAWFVPVEWYWGGTLAAIAAPALIATALFVSARVPATGSNNAQAQG